MSYNYFILAMEEIKHTGLPTPNADTHSVQNILSIVFAIVGALSLLMITISGLRYILSSGDPQQASQAKNGIVYALIGLTVAISAQLIVSFVVGQL